jgi:hypothetical protein
MRSTLDSRSDGPGGGFTTTRTVAQNESNLLSDTVPDDLNGLGSGKSADPFDRAGIRPIRAGEPTLALLYIEE